MLTNQLKSQSNKNVRIIPKVVEVVGVVGVVGDVTGNEFLNNHEIKNIEPKQ
jgi:uncharacterized membrane protein